MLFILNLFSIKDNIIKSIINNNDTFIVSLLLLVCFPNMVELINTENSNINNFINL